MKKHLIYLLLILIIMAGSAIINSLPAGFIVSGSDFPYILNVENHLDDTLYFWSNLGTGLGSPDRANSVVLRYLVVYSLKLLGFSDTQVLNINFFLFIFLAAISAYLGLGILSKFKVKPVIYFISSLFYSFNSFTLYGFTASWMYHPIYDIYIFLPLISALFIKGIIDKNKKYLAISIIIFLISLSGFSNPAFLIAFFIFLMISLSIFFIFGLIKKGQLLISGIVLLLYLAVLAFYVGPIAYEFIYGYANPVIGSLSLTSIDVIKIASSQAIHALRLMNDNPTLFFPNNFPYLSSLKPIFIFLSIYPAIFITLALLFTSKKNKKMMLTFALSLIVFVYIAVKINFPFFQNVTVFLFNLPLLNGLRASDKTYPFIAFFVTVLTFYFLEGVSSQVKSNNKSKRFEHTILAVSLSVVLIFSLPFFLGKFQQTMTMDKPKAIFSHLVKVPQAYKKIAAYVNKDKDNYKIIHMPYGGLPHGFEATLWSYYPKWKFFGSDITKYYFDNSIINPNDYIGNFNFGKYFYKHPSKIQTFINTLRIFGVRYLIIDKNVDPIYYGSFKKMFIENDLKSSFKLIKAYKNLELYRINTEKELPQIYSSSSEGSMLVVGDSNAIPIIMDKPNIKPVFFLSKSSISEPLNLFKYADNVIFSEGDVLDLAMDLLPQNMGDINGLRFLIKNKVSSINIPFSGSFEVFARVKTDQNYFRRDYFKLDQLMLEKNIRYSDRPVFGKNLIGRIKEGKWRYKGLISLSKGNHILGSSQKVEEVIIIPKKDFKNYISSIQKILPKKSTGYFTRKKDSNKYYLEMSNKKNLPKGTQLEVKFSKINPTKYIVKLDSRKPNWLIFSESFHKGWKAYYGRVNWWQALWRKPINESNHFLVNGYANAWHIDKTGNYEITLFFWPQGLFYIGLIISGLTLFGCVGYLGYEWRKGRLAREKFWSS